MLERQRSEIQRTILYTNNDFEIVSIDWSEGAKSPTHNHGWSQCQVFIENGVFENTLNAGAKTEIRRLEPGQVLNTPIGASHEMRCLTKNGKTLHVYTPKIRAHKDIERKFNSQVHADLLSSLRLGESVRFDQLSDILRSIEENAISTHSPYFMNQLFSGVHPQALLADEIISRCKTTMATQEASRVFSIIESEVIDQLCRLIGWSADRRDGVCVPGGSAANFMALHLAKQKSFPETKHQGIYGSPFKIFVSSDAHYSMEKAAAAMGFGTDALIKIDVCKERKMIPERLSEAVEHSIAAGHVPLLVCATAGTTVYGAFDSMRDISFICRAKNIWLHVDAAWGGPALFSKRIKTLFNGVELADSVTFDAHKLFGASLTSSFLLTQHKGLLLEANDVSGADYLFHENSSEMDLGKLSWQCGRRADALNFWALWKNLGTEGLGDFVDRLLALRDESLGWIQQQDRIDVVHQPSFLNLCFRIKPPSGISDSEWSIKVRENLKAKNLAMLNYSRDSQGAFLRFIFANPQLNISHIKEILTHALGEQ